MAEVVGSVLVQECLSKAISFVLGRREEKVSQGVNAERLEMAVSQLEFALERTAKLPVMELSLLHRRKMIKRAYLEGTELLNKHKQLQELQEGQQEEVAQAQGANLKRSRWVTILAKNNLSISSFAGLKTDDVRRFEWFADHAGKFVRDVESGCSLRHHTFCNPLVRLLLEGKTLRHQVLLQGSSQLRRRLYMQPICLEGRGVETVLIYQYRDYCKTSTLDRSFNLVLILRLSESTDIVGTAIVCLQWMASQFKIPTEAAMGELTLVPDVQFTSHPYATRCHAEIEQESYGNDTQYLRPDPVCCKQANLHGPCANSMFPEEVIHFFFRCSSSALDWCSSLPSSLQPHDEGAGKRRRAPLDLTIGCLPHHVYKHKEQQQLLESSYALEINGDDDQERVGASVAQGAETLIRSKATSFFLRQPAELTEYRMLWIYRHGVAGFFLEKPGIKRTKTSGSRSMSSRLAAACHRSMSVQQRRSLKRERTEDQCHDGHACPFGPWAV
ncbi:unnamed protein product [Miscanthus lutarioriparius]|uniref:Uncharacterized protein n=1 Tax=Miscanthus lutarioriparius TaxID=422564 RepID=A0A811NI38_9POAL|nr:unnamed protein product [Miscanthus lutarioriparius]